MQFQRSNKNFVPPIDSLDDSQRKPIESDAPEVVIKASAGSGKTRVLISAVSDYRYKYINDRICAITFTRAARAEMEARLREMGIYDVEVTTIHVWARNMLDYFADKYDFKVQVLEESQIKAILQDIVREYLLRSKARSVNINILYTYITGSKTMDITENYRRTLNALEARYIHYKRQNNLYDFTDYPQYLWDIMEIFDESINNIDALFVDEFQDVDHTQFKIFQKVNANKKFFIGDPWQSIYIFREADGEVFNKLDNFKFYKLKYNYRSFQEIIDYATTVYTELYDDAEAEIGNCYISKILDVEPSSIICNRGYGGRVIIINPFASAFEISGSAEIHGASKNWVYEIEDMLKLNPMILCRTNKQVKALQEFGFTNVSTVHQAKGLEYDNVVVVDHEINSVEDLNIAYVALTRAKDSVLVVSFAQLENYLKRR